MKTLSLVLLLVGLGASQALAQIDVSCKRGQCFEFGWDMRTSTGLFGEVECHYPGDCYYDGWVERSAGRVVAETLCRRGGCFEEGYDVYDASGRWISEVLCRSGRDGPSDCLTYGWVVRHYNGGRAYVNCIERNCRERGWTIETPRRLQRVRCNAGGCFQSGWTLYP